MRTTVPVRSSPFAAPASSSRLRLPACCVWMCPRALPKATHAARLQYLCGRFPYQQLERVARHFSLLQRSVAAASDGPASDICVVVASDGRV